MLLLWTWLFSTPTHSIFFLFLYKGVLLLPVASFEIEKFLTQKWPIAHKKNWSTCWKLLGSLSNHHDDARYDAK